MPSLQRGSLHQGLSMPHRCPNVCWTKQESYVDYAYKPFPCPAPVNGFLGSHATTHKKRGSSIRSWLIIHQHFDGRFYRSCYVSQELRKTTEGRTIHSSELSIDATIQWPSHIWETHFRGSIPSLQRDITMHTQFECAGCPTLQYCQRFSPSTMCHVCLGSAAQLPFTKEIFSPSHWGFRFRRCKSFVLWSWE